MLLAGSTRYLRQPVQSGDSPEGKTPPPWGVLCSQRGVDQLWAERVPGGLRKVRYKASRGVGAEVAVRPPPPFPPPHTASDRAVPGSGGAEKGSKGEGDSREGEGESTVTVVTGWALRVNGSYSGEGKGCPQ